MKFESIDLAPLLAGERALPQVQYAFACDELPAVLWQVRRFQLCEGLSEPYQLELDLVTDTLDVDAERLLGASCELRIERQITMRTVCGVIASLEIRPRIADRFSVHVVVVPALALLDLRSDTRLWQKLTVPQIVEQVLNAGLGEHGREVDVSHLRSHYDEREYVVQYRESDMSFVARLLEDEGITYWFDHERGSGKEVLVLEDSAEWPEIPTVDGDATLAVIAEREHQAEVESLQRIDWCRTLRSTTVVRRTFDWLEPTRDIEERVPAAGEPTGDARNLVREIYEHGRLVESRPRARVEREHEGLGGEPMARGHANVTGFAPGRRFRSSEPDREVLLVRVTHRGDCPEVELGPAEARASYVNEFMGTHFDGTPWRPPRRAERPRMHGPETAIVTGPENEEIHTDEHGRIKVRFVWDRQHVLTDDTSMWIRVTQRWAGAGFGCSFIPRVGMEVVVEFIDGNPDQPLVTGCVYNGDARTSLALPSEKTQSAIRTRSSPGGAGFNELRFEDAAGSEVIFVHAQRDLCETVGREHVLDTGSHERVSIGGDQNETIAGQQTRSVGKDRTTTIAGSEVLTIDGSRTEHVHGSDSLTVDGPAQRRHLDSHETWITGSATQHVLAGNRGPAQSTVWVEGKHGLIVDDLATATVGKGYVINQGGGQASLSVREGAIEQQAAKDWSSCAGGLAELNAGDRVAIVGSNKVELAQGNASVTLMNGTLVLQATEIRLVAGDNVLVLDASGLHIRSATVDIAATDTCTIQAALVNID